MSDPSVLQIIGSDGTGGTDATQPQQNSTGSPAVQGTPGKNSCPNQQAAGTGTTGIDGSGGGSPGNGTMVTQAIFNLGEVTGTVTIDFNSARGGKGGNGAKGGQGGNGGAGADKNGSCVALLQGKGGQGGNGGSGKKGGNGAECPVILITYTGSTAPSVIFPTQEQQAGKLAGGAGGKEGGAGDGGEGSPGGAIGESTGSPGDAGNTGKYKTYTIRPLN